MFPSTFAHIFDQATAQSLYRVVDKMDCGGKVACAEVLADKAKGIKGAPARRAASANKLYSAGDQLHDGTQLVGQHVGKVRFADDADYHGTSTGDGYLPTTIKINKQQKCDVAHPYGGCFTMGKSFRAGPWSLEAPTPGL